MDLTHPGVIFVSDVMRCLTIGGALWLILLVARLMILRSKMPTELRQGRVQPPLVLSYMTLLFIIVLGRVEALGGPPNLLGVADFTAVALGIVGARQRVQFRPLRAYLPRPLRKAARRR